jgi:hypothetical protein
MNALTPLQELLEKALQECDKAKEGGLPGLVECQMIGVRQSVQDALDMTNLCSKRLDRPNFYK